MDSAPVVAGIMYGAGDGPEVPPRGLRCYWVDRGRDLVCELLGRLHRMHEKVEMRTQSTIWPKCILHVDPVSVV